MAERGSFAPDWDSIISQGFNTLDNQLNNRADYKQQQLISRNERFRDETSRGKSKRDYELDRFRNRSDRIEAAQASSNDLFSRETTRELGLRDAKREQFESQTARTTQAQSDVRDLIASRAKVYKDAFESRRGDTIISRITGPLAVAAGIGGAIYIFTRVVVK